MHNCTGNLTSYPLKKLQTGPKNHSGLLETSTRKLGRNCTGIKYEVPACGRQAMYNVQSTRYEIRGTKYDGNRVEIDCASLREII